MQPNHGYRGKLCAFRTGRILPFFLQLLALCAVLFVSASTGFAQSADGPTSVLRKGDRLPDEIWNLPLQVVNHPEGKEVITLNEYRGQVIVLDFWSTFCTTCIVNMPHFEALQKQFAEQLKVVPVTWEDDEKIDSFVKSSPIWSKLNIASVVNGGRLRASFPSESLPHIVIVDKTGMVRAITLGEYLSKEVVRDLVDGKAQVYIPQKRERLDQPLLAISSAYNDVNTASPLYYSTVSGFMDGLEHFTTLRPDTVNGVPINRYCVANTDLMKLYAIALAGTSLPLSTQHRILEVKDPSRYVYAWKNFSKINWRRDNYYTYEAVLPANVSEDDAKRKMKTDLDLFFQMHGRVEKRVVPCLALIEVKPEQDKYKAKGGKKLYVIKGVIPNRFVDRAKKVGPTTSGATTYVRNMGFKDLHGTFNRLLDKEIPVILNKTGYTGKFDLDLPDVPASLAALKLALQKQGLDLVPTEQEMEVFVLTENGYSHGSDQLQFTDYGYVPKRIRKISSR